MRPHSTPNFAPDGFTGPSGDPQRFDGIRRDYTQEDVERLSGSFRIRHTLAEMGASAAVAPAEDASPSCRRWAR